jgi:hypothetical protein
MTSPAQPDDPFMPATRRFPRDTWPLVGSDELPSGMRPFVLRGAQQVPSAVTAKHRTAPHRTSHTSTTSKDGTSVSDTWYEQDD